MWVKARSKQVWNTQSRFIRIRSEFCAVSVDKPGLPHATWQQGIVDWRPGMDEEQPAIAAARAVVTRVAPQELNLFGAMSRVFVEHPDRMDVQRRGGDDFLGFGLAEA